ncbi:mechanosensitive ion channel [bacterium]|nr:mechanosensitive ion channel [bacterium]
MSIYLLAHNLSLFLTRLGFSRTELFFLSLLVFVAVLASLSTFKFVNILVLSILEKRFQNASIGLWRKIFDHLGTASVLFYSFYAMSIILPWPRVIHILLTSIFIFIVVMSIIDVIRICVENVVRIYLRFKNNVSEATVKMVINLINVVDTIVMWLIAALVALWIADIDVQGLVNGLGIASIIVAFSFQNSLKDLFAFFTLYIDRSFAVGDYIAFGNNGFAGTIKEIHLRTTRIRALRGNELVVSNYELTNSIIENYHRMGYRRVSFPVKIKQTPAATADNLENTVVQFKQLFNRPDIKDRTEVKSVTVDELSDYGIQIKIIYRFLHDGDTGNYFAHLAYKEKINLGVMRILQSNGLELNQTLVV